MGNNGLIHRKQTIFATRSAPKVSTLLGMTTVNGTNEGSRYVPSVAECHAHVSVNPSSRSNFSAPAPLHSQVAHF
jgi:hypothetical protein